MDRNDGADSRRSPPHRPQTRADTAIAKDGAAGPRFSETMVRETRERMALAMRPLVAEVESGETNLDVEYGGT